MISGIFFNVRDLDKMTLFYRHALNMQLLETFTYNGKQCSVIGYPNHGASLYLIEHPNCQPSSITRPGYWKIGITCNDIQAFTGHINSLNWPITPPSQFRNIGYLCHLQDPEGNTIELLQHTFEGRPLSSFSYNTVAHISLRTLHPELSIKFYKSLGMRLLSKQSTDMFDLYFLAQTTDILPDPDIESVSNREWLWQRPYSCIELQHIPHPHTPTHYEIPKPHEHGWQGILLDDSNHTSSTQKYWKELDKDPDGYPLFQTTK